MNQPKSKTSLAILDIVRTVTTFWILLFHLNHPLTVFFGPLPLIRHGYLGVDIFFILSGFLIAYHYRDVLLPFDKSAYKRFLLTRLIRLYPLHLVTLAMVAAIVFLAPLAGFTINNPDRYGAGSFVAHLFLASAWNFPAVMTWNDYAWAISALWLAYLVSPLLIAAIAKINNTFSFITCTASLIFLTPFAQALWPQDSYVAYALFRVIGGFGLGLLLCRWMEWKHASLPTIAFGRRFFEYGAKVSYAVYMVQFIVIMLFKKALPPENYSGLGLIYISAEIACVLVTGVILHTLIEEPAKKWLQGKESKQPLV